MNLRRVRLDVRKGARNLLASGKGEMVITWTEVIVLEIVLQMDMRDD